MSNSGGQAARCYTSAAMSSDDFAAGMNESLTGWNKAMGLYFVRATVDEVVGRIDVGEQHRQPYGIVHGGVHSGLIEALCSVGAALFALSNGQSVVGLENHTSFLKAVRSGRLTITATPLSRGRRAQVWEGSVRDESERLVATGRVRLLCLDANAQLAGQGVDMVPR